MDWNAIPEYISLIYLIIICIYSNESNIIPTIKNRVFKITIYTVLLGLLSSIFTSIIIENQQYFSLFTRHFVTTLFYITTPLIAVMFVTYTITIIFEETRCPKGVYLLFIPYILYFFVAITSPITKIIYFYDELTGFTLGPFVIVVYLISFFYLILNIFLPIFFSDRVNKSQIMIFIAYPVVAIIGVIGQLLLKNLVLSGTAATTSLTIIYISLQNKKILIDELTGVSNRSVFLKMMEYHIKKKHNMTILLIDPNDFKSVNNKFGQTKGDSLLNLICEYLKTIVSKKIIYRYNGDEFAIILTNNRENVNHLVDKIQNRFTLPWLNNDIQHRLTTNISVVNYPEDALNVAEIVNLLEYCLKLSKNKGKGKTIFSSPQIEAEIKRKAQIISILKQGIVNHDLFIIHYQPIFSLEKQRFVSAESLLRVYEDKIGLISPSEFIPIAEETGLIIDIGYIILDKVCKYLNYLEKNNIQIDGISVNISPLQMINDGFSHQVLNIIKNNKITPDKIKLEVTESTFIDNFEEMKEVMLTLVMNGISFYLDDFGTNYSNLARVIELPFEYIKIDRSLLYNSLQSKKCFQIVSSLTNAFRNLGIKVLMEGVETTQQNDLMKQLKIEYMQGFYYAKPVDEQEFPQLFIS